MQRSFAFGVGFAALLWGTPSSADQRQLQALLAKYFLQNHQAIALHNNGDVKSGDVLHMPDEGTYVSRKICYQLPEPPKYRNLDAEFIQATKEVTGEVGGTLPIEKIADIEATIGGKLRRVEAIVLDPFEDEQPPGGFVVLRQPNSDAKCDINRDILSGKARDYILVTLVFHGMRNAIASLDISGNVAATADIEKKIKALLGSTPKLSVKGSGSNITLEYSTSPDEHSLAVQSAFVNPQQLARLYLRYRTANGFQLERRVYEYLYGDPGLYDRVRIAIGELLRVMEIQPTSPAALYSLVFSGEGAVPISEARVPQEQWNALATIAAALVIVAQGG